MDMFKYRTTYIAECVTFAAAIVVAASAAQAQPADLDRAFRPCRS
jgi:hypothetical protein